MFKYYFPADDAINYFTLKAMNEPIGVFKSLLCRRHPAIASRIEKTLSPSAELEKLLDAAVSISPEQLAFFFRPEPTLKGELIPLSTPARMLLGYRAGRNDTPSSLTELVAVRSRLSEDEKADIFASCFYNLQFFEAAEQTAGINGERKSVLNVLRELDADQNLRVRLIELYINFDELVTELAKLLSPAVEIIEMNEWMYRESLEKLEKTIDEAGGPGNYALLTNGISVNEKGKHQAHPCVLAPNLVSIHNGIFDGMDIYIGVCVPELQKLLYEGQDGRRLSSVFKILADETRLEMLHCVGNKPMYGLEIAEKFSVSAPTVSYHMNKLISGGFVKSYYENGKNYYKADAEGIFAFARDAGRFFGVINDDKNKKD